MARVSGWWMSDLSHFIGDNNLQCEQARVVHVRLCKPTISRDRVTICQRFNVMAPWIKQNWTCFTHKSHPNMLVEELGSMRVAGPSQPTTLVTIPTGKTTPTPGMPTISTTNKPESSAKHTRTNKPKISPGQTLNTPKNKPQSSQSTTNKPSPNPEASANGPYTASDQILIITKPKANPSQILRDPQANTEQTVTTPSTNLNQGLTTENHSQAVRLHPLPAPKTKQSLRKPWRNPTPTSPTPIYKCSTNPIDKPCVTRQFGNAICHDLWVPHFTQSGRLVSTTCWDRGESRTKCPVLPNERTCFINDLFQLWS